MPLLVVPLSCPWRRLTLWHAMQLSDVAAPILCSHALHGKERVMACRSRLFRFHGTYLLASHAVNSSLLTSRCRRKSSHQVFKTFLSGFSSKRSDRHRCSQLSSVTNSFRLKTSFSSAVGCNHGWVHLLSFICAQTQRTCARRVPLKMLQLLASHRHRHPLRQLAITRTHHRQRAPRSRMPQHI